MDFKFLYSGKVFNLGAMKKENIPAKFNRHGEVRGSSGRKPLAVELNKIDTFNRLLNRVGANALEKTIGTLYKMALDEDQNPVVRVRCMELILAYSIGRPTEVEHHTNQQVAITFVRAEPPTAVTKSLPDSETINKESYDQ